jgi:hypothetical protein
MIEAIATPLRFGVDVERGVIGTPPPVCGTIPHSRVAGPNKLFCDGEVFMLDFQGFLHRATSATAAL